MQTVSKITLFKEFWCNEEQRGRDCGFKGREFLKNMTV